jgi:hypothetical protein
MVAFALPWPACAADPSPALSYKVVKQEIVDRPSQGKLKQSIAVAKGTQEDAIRQLLYALHSAALRREWKSNSTPGVWIWVFDDERTTAETPDAWIAMLSASPGSEPEIRISTALSMPPKPPRLPIGTEVLGTWRYISGGVSWTNVLRKEKNAVTLDYAFDDGSSRSQTVVESNDARGRKFVKKESRLGEYVIIEQDGSLGLYDQDGRFGKAVPVP